MFVYTIWDIATVGLLAIGVVVCVLGCIAFVIKEIAIKAASKVNEMRGENDDDGNDECDITYMLEKLPSAEPKTGKWVEVEKDEYEGFSIVSMRCNQCGKYAYHVLPKGTKCVYDYCPWCKADMRGEEE